MDQPGKVAIVLKRKIVPNFTYFFIAISKYRNLRGVKNTAESLQHSFQYDNPIPAHYGPTYSTLSGILYNSFMMKGVY